MVKKEILKPIYLLKELPDHFLEKIGEIAQVQECGKEEILYRQNEVQTVLYMLVKGKVLLNLRSSKGQLLTLDEVLPGRTFGVTALLNESRTTFAAVCAEPCTLITVSGKKMQQLFQQDFEMGHVLMREMVEMYKIRRERHIQQFVHSLKIHPEIKQFEE
ncbi:MAG: cyclic nucleotide-binding domain-containing protein [Pseudomonadota bacterium]